MKNHTNTLKLLAMLSLSLGYAGTAHATTGCNAVGWNERHGVTGCGLYYPAIHWMYEEGIASGDAATGKFFPERPINRAEFTKLVLLASGITNPPPCASAPFPDVPKDAWFAPYICSAKGKGIISGFPDGTFKPGIDVNFANGAKILAKTFHVPMNSDDADFDLSQNIWYRPYTLGLLKKRAVAPTVKSFAQSLTRGEMAEMLYRLATGNNAFDNPVQTEDGDYLGYGFGPYDLEQPLGLDVNETPDPPYVFSANERTETGIFSKKLTLKGFAFSHVLQAERCGASGLWEHCQPTFVDWSVGLYMVPTASFDPSIQSMGSTQRYFGGKAGNCVTLGIEGENTEYCIVPLAKNKTLVVIRDYIDAGFVLVPGATPLATSDAMYARIRKSLSFLEANIVETPLTFTSAYFTLSFQLPAEFEVLEGQNFIRIAQSPYYTREIGDDNAFFSLMRYDQRNTYESVLALYRKLLHYQKETMTTVDGSKFLTLRGDDWGRFEGDSAGKVTVVFFEKSWVEIIEKPANTQQNFDPQIIGNQILTSFKFSK